MSEYSLSVRLPSCKVSRVLLEELEEYLSRKVSELVVAQSEDRPVRKTYEVIIKDSIGAEKFDSIKDFDRSYFPNDIKAIQLKWNSWGSATEKLNIALKFDRENLSSELDITFNGPSAREVAKSLSGEVFTRLEPYKTTNRFFALFSPISVVMLCILFLLSLPLIISSFSDSRPPHATAMLTLGIVLGILAIGYFSLMFFKPYTSFETSRNQIIERRVNWIVVGIIGFILFTVAGVYFRQRLLGF